jgi:hypothetical protein
MVGMGHSRWGSRVKQGGVVWVGSRCLLAAGLAWAAAAAVLLSTASIVSADSVFTTGCSVHTIPAGDNTVAITAFGANGTAGFYPSGLSGNASAGGSGAGVSATVTEVTGDLDVCVNVGGGSGNSSYPGQGYGTGGGASGVSLGDDFSHPVVVAGGGGGGAGRWAVPSGSGNGGNAAYPNGGSGAGGEDQTGSGDLGGGGGGQNGGGAGGYNDYNGANNSGGSCSSASGPGGGGSDDGDGGYGGGGGGGYCGGGAGAGESEDNGGGGGGSDFCTNSVAPRPPFVSQCSESGDGFYAPEVILTYSYTQPTATVYVNDGGSGQVVEVPGWGAAPTAIGAGSPTASYTNFKYNNAAGLALDPAGDVFTPNDSAGTVNEIPAGGGSETTIGGIDGPNAVAGDQSNDLFVAAEYGVQEMVNGNVGNDNVGDTGGGTEGVARDAAGDVFIGDTDFSDSGSDLEGRVVEVPADGSPQRTIYGGSGTSSLGAVKYPSGVAVDAAGDVYFADTDNNRVLKVTPAGTASTVASNLTDPEGVALDAYGNVFIANAGANNVIEVPAGGGSQTIIGSGFSFSDPSGLAVYAPPPTFTADTPPRYAAPNSSYRYTYTAQAQPNEPAPTFSLASGQLPPGLTLNPTTGVLSGTIPQGGPWTFQVQTQNIANATATPPTTIVTAPPTVTGVSPASGPTGAGGPVTITGTNFAAGGTTVNFGSSPATQVQVQSPTTLTAMAPAGSAGTVDVTVATADGTSQTSGADQYTYVLAPTLSQVSPDVGSEDGQNTVTITGTNFGSDATVNFGSDPATAVNVESSTTLLAVAPAGTGTVDVTVTTAGGTSAISESDQYAYDPPSVSAVDPTIGPMAGGNTVTITGTNFVPGASVAFGVNAASSVNVQSSTTLTAVAPAGSGGTVDVTVSDADGSSTTSPADHYTYFVAPTVTRVSPGSGSVVGGNTITITGTHFVSGATVNVGSNAATSVTFVSSTKLTAVVPSAGAGKVDVTVSTPPDATSATSPADGYTYLPHAGAVLAVDGSSHIIQMFPGGPQATVGSGGGTAGGLAVDAAGDVFALDPYVDNNVVEFPAGGGGPRPIPNQQNTASAMTVDAQGDVFTDDQHNGLLEYPAGGGQPVTLDPNILYGDGMAVDDQGDVYVSDVDNNVVDEVHPDGTQTTVASINQPEGLAVDVKGDLFIADYGDEQVVEIPAGGGGAFTIGSVPFAGPTGVALDAAGDVFVSQSYANNVIEIPAGGGAQTTLANLASPSSVAAYAPPPTFTADSPPASAAVGQSYSYTYTASAPAGEPNATFALASGTLPPGLTLDPTTGVLSGAITSAGSYTFRVQTENAAQASLGPLTTITTAPTVTKLSPAAGPTAGGTTVTISGSGFTADSGVLFGTVAATSVTFVSPTQLTAVSPAQAAGSRHVFVTTVGGKSAITTTDEYTYQ